MTLRNNLDNKIRPYTFNEHNCPMTINLSNNIWHQKSNLGKGQKSQPISWEARAPMPFLATLLYACTKQTTYMLMFGIELSFHIWSCPIAPEDSTWLCRQIQASSGKEHYEQTRGK